MNVPYFIIQRGKLNNKNASRRSAGELASIFELRAPRLYVEMNAGNMRNLKQYPIAAICSSPIPSSRQSQYVSQPDWRTCHIIEHSILAIRIIWMLGLLKLCDLRM